MSANKLLVCCLLVTLTPAAYCAWPLPAPSQWKLNVSASNFGDAPVIKEDDVTIIASSSTFFAWKEHEVMGNGLKANLGWSGPLDNTFHPVSGGHRSRARFSADGVGHFEIRGGIIEDATLSVSEDGKTLIETVTVKTKNGPEQHARWIYDRTQ